VACASKSANFCEGATAASSGPLPVSERKGNGGPALCRPARDESRSSVETQTHDPGMEAFQQMFVACRPKFLAMANAILRNREDAEDAVQSAFVSGHIHLGSFEGRSALTTWFTRIVLNSALIIRRKRKAQRIISPSETSTSDEGRQIESIPASQPDPEMVYAQREAFRFIDGMLEQMKPALRQALTMTYYDEMRCAEVCALLGVPVSTFKTRLSRARRRLLCQAQRILVAPVTRNPSRFRRDKNRVQTIVANRHSSAVTPTGLSE
jgi:RNA polymerase sigma factor (sigma-70 family)